MFLQQQVRLKPRHGIGCIIASDVERRDNSSLQEVRFSPLPFQHPASVAMRAHIMHSHSDARLHVLERLASPVVYCAMQPLLSTFFDIRHADALEGTS